MNELVLLILSVVSPVIVSYITKANMSFKAKQLVALAVSLVIAAAVAFSTGGASLIFTGIDGFAESLVVALPIVYTIQQVVYSFMFKNTEFAHNVLVNHGVGKNDYDGKHVAE